MMNWDFFSLRPFSPVYYCLCSAVDVLCSWVLFAIVDIFSFSFFRIKSKFYFFYTKRDGTDIKRKIHTTSIKFVKYLHAANINEWTTLLVIPKKIIFSLAQKHRKESRNIFADFLAKEYFVIFCSLWKTNWNKRTTQKNGFVYFYFIRLKLEYPCKWNASTHAISQSPLETVWTFECNVRFVSLCLYVFFIPQF